jgi:anti-sigma factor RsiW
MRCEGLELRISEYLDGELDPAERGRIERHLAECERCRRFTEELRRADRALAPAARRLAMSGPPSSAERLWGRHRRRRNFSIGWKSAAAAAMIGLTGFFVYVAAKSAPPHNVTVYGASVLAPGAPAALRVVVENLKAGRLGAATVRVLLGERELGRGSALAGQAATVPIALPDLPEGSYRLDVRAEAETGDAEISVPVEIRRPWRIMLTTDKPVYQPTHTVHVRVLAKDVLTGRPVAREAGEILIENPDGIRLMRRPVQTSEFGIASADFELADEVVFGRHRVTVRFGRHESERAFDVRRYVLPKFRVQAAFDKPWYSPGDEARLRIGAEYFFGKPVEAKDQRVRLEGRVGSVWTGFAGAAVPQVEEIRAHVEVKDSAGHVETAVASAAVSKEPVLFQALPYGGKFVEGRENEVFVFATTPDGRPAALDGFDSNGVRRLRTREPRIIVEGRELDLSTYQEALVLYVDRVKLRGGESLKVRALSSAETGTVYLDLVKDRQTYLTQALDLSAGAAELVLDIPPELFGTLWLSAYRFRTDGAPITDRRPLLVEPPQELAIDVVPAKPSTRPGEPIEVEFRVGGGGRAALGISAVDAAVFALYETYPGLEKVFFEIEEDLLKPRWQIKPLQAPVPQAPAALLASRLSNIATAAPEAIGKLTFAELDRAVRSYKDQVIGAALSIALLLAFLGLVTGVVVSIVRRSGWLGGLCLLLLILGSAVILLPATLQATRAANERIAQAGGEPAPPAGPEEPRIRSRFPETLYWNPEAITDERGVARLTLPAADSITTWKLAVSAIDAKGRLGAATRDLVVFQEFFADLDLPLVLTEGDEVTVPVALYNYLKTDQEVRVVLEPADWYETPVREKSARLAPDGVGSVQFRIKALRHGWHKLTAKAYGTGGSDAIERVIEVIPDGMPVESSRSDRFTRKGTSTFVVPPEAIAPQAWLKIFPSTFSEILTGLDSLVRLPYG